MSSKIQILDIKAVNQKLNRLAWQVYEHNSDAKEIIIVGIANRGLKIAKQLAKNIESISKIKTTIGYLELDKENPYNKEVSIESINEAMIKASKGSLKGILAVNSAPLVSKDFNHNPHSSIFDLTQTQVIKGKFCRILSWYDNEWGFSNRMCDTAIQIAGLI